MPSENFIRDSESLIDRDIKRILKNGYFLERHVSVERQTNLYATHACMKFDSAKYPKYQNIRRANK